MKIYQFEKQDRDFYMDVSMVSKYLHFATSTIYKWVGENYIPYKKLGKRVIFVKNDIDSWVQYNGMIVEELPEIPKFTTIVKDLPDETRSTVRNLNPQPMGLGDKNLKYRRVG
jgi:excisionase family DNA binding protein